MAVIYTVEQLEATYQQAKNEADSNRRNQLLNFILTESVNTNQVYIDQMERAAQVYGVVLKREEIQKTVVGVAQTVGIASSNVYGYAVAGIAYLYDALTRKTRTAKVQAAIAEIEKLKAKATMAAQLYEAAKKDLNTIKIQAVVYNCKMA